MNAKLTRYQNIQYESFETWGDLCSSNEWCALPASKVPFSHLPPTLSPKIISAFIVHSGNTGTISYVLADLHRQDRNRKGNLIIDHQPLIMCYDHLKNMGIGAFINHADFTGSRYDPFVTSGLFVTASGAGLIQCVSGLWMQEHAGLFADLERKFPLEARAFSYAVSMLKSSPFTFEPVRFVEVNVNGMQN